VHIRTRALFIGLIILSLTSCKRPFAQKENGDLDVASVWSWIACSTKKNKIDPWRPDACGLLKSFDESDTALRAPSGKGDRYLGWLRPIGNSKAPFPEGAAFIVEKKNGRVEATLIPIESPNEDVFRDVVAGDRTDGLDKYFVRKDVDVSRRLDRVAGSPTHFMEQASAITYVRRDGERLILVHMVTAKNRELHYGRTYAPVWIGELHSVD
jgi:hypothetical protein